MVIVVATEKAAVSIIMHCRKCQCTVESGIGMWSEVNKWSVFKQPNIGKLLNIRQRERERNRSLCDIIAKATAIVRELGRNVLGRQRNVQWNNLKLGLYRNQTVDGRETCLVLVISVMMRNTSIVMKWNDVAILKTCRWQWKMKPEK